MEAKRIKIRGCEVTATPREWQDRIYFKFSVGRGQACWKMGEGWLHGHQDVDGVVKEALEAAYGLEV